MNTNLLFSFLIKQIDLGIPGARPRTEADMLRVDKLNDLISQKDQLMVKVREHLRLNQKPHQSRVYLPNISDRFNHTRTRQRKSTAHSFVAGRNVHQYQQEESNPFSEMTRDLEVLAKDRLDATIKHPQLREPCTIKKFCSKPCKCSHTKPVKQCSSVGKHKKTFSFRSVSENTLNGCEVNLQLERLQVPNFPLPPSMLDYQKNYFTCLRDRPLKEHFKQSDFSKMQRTAFFKTVMSGYIKDDICRRKEQIQLDKWELKGISHELDVVKKVYKKFIDQSNEESVTLVKDQLRAGHLRDEVEAKWMTHKAVLSSVKTQIFKLESQLNTLLLCRDILLKLSPSTWRSQYQDEVRNYKPKMKWRDDVIHLYEEYCRYYPEKGKDFFLDEAMELVIKEVDAMGPPSIYFTESWQIMMVLRKKELDCTNQIHDILTVERQISEIEALYKELNRYRRAEEKIMKDKMDEGHAEFEYQKRRQVQLEAKAEAVIPQYVEVLFSGDIMLETAALVEVLYTDFFGESKQNPEPLEMMTAIETELRRQKDEMSEVNRKLRKHFRNKIEADEKKKYKEAMRAKRVYREVKSFLKSAKGMFTPPPRVPRTWKIPVRRSAVPPVKKAKSRSSSKREEKCQHFQVAGIMMNDEVEESLERAISAYRGLPFRPPTPTEDSDDSSAKHNSLLSDASTASLEKFAYDKADQSSRTLESRSKRAVSFKMDPKDELSMVEVGYDSEDELIHQNYDSGKMDERPPVMYDVKTVDDRFIVEGEYEKLTEKNRIHVSREPRQNVRHNPLSWR